MKKEKAPAAPFLPPRIIQIRDVDGQLHAAVKGKAASLGLTMEQFIIQLMQEATK